MSGKFLHSVDQTAVEIDFFGEFGDQLSDTQISMLTTGFRSLAASSDVDPNDIDPVDNPALARQALVEQPQSVLEVGERPFVLPLVRLLQASKQDIPPEIQILTEQHDFYLVKFGINAVIKNKEQLRSLEIKFEYPNDLGFITYALTPDTEIEKRFSTEASVTVGLDANLGFSVPDIDIPGGTAGGGARAKAAGNLMYKWQYALLKANIIATGVKSSYARWQIEQPANLIGSVELVTVLTSPKGRESLDFDVEGRYDIDRGWGWWKKTTPVMLRSAERISVPLQA